MTAPTQIPFAGISNPVNFRNRIINGNMQIDQRNNGASVTADNTYSVDRFLFRETTDGTASIQQSTTAPTNFINSILFTVTGTDSSLSSNQYAAIQQRIEGFNVSDLNFGSANAKTVTLSFWVRSSVTGSFGASLSNSAGDRSYPVSFTISSANTFEYKTFTIPGDTSGTWLTNNGIGIQLTMGAASNLLGTANTWASAFYIGVTGNTNLMATNGATFYITGVQLEAGDQASGFEFMPIDTNLSRCQRYFQKSYDLETVPGTNTTQGDLEMGLTSNGANDVLTTIPYKVSMRATPTITYYTTSGTSGSWGYARSGASGNATMTAYAGRYGQNYSVSYLGSGSAFVAVSVIGHFTASAEL